jgi:hypothetical protein
MHTPIVLLRPGETATLAFDTVCGCEATGVVYVRPHNALKFSAVPLVARRSVLTADVDPTVAQAGFAYYAVISDPAHGLSVTIPRGGAAGPHRVWALSDVPAIPMGEHQFGSVRKPSQVSLQTTWGAGVAQAGLVPPEKGARAGPASFDVLPDGRVALLDQVNGRILLGDGQGGAPSQAFPVPVTTLADLRVNAKGGYFVLQEPIRGTEFPVLRILTSAGAVQSVVPVPERIAPQLAAVADLPLAHQYPSDMWMPLTDRGSTKALSPAVQAARAAEGTPTADGQLVVKAMRHEVRVAEVAGDRVKRAWVLTSDTDLGEVQLAEPLRDGVLVVVRPFSETQAEFTALYLRGTGLERAFSVPAIEWADSESNSRFRLRGRSLYELASAMEGVKILRYDV